MRNTYKGSVSNLNNAGAQMGVIVIGKESLLLLGKQPAQKGKKTEVLEQVLLERAYRWVHAEAQPKGRIVIMSERELIEWAERTGPSRPSRSGNASNACAGTNETVKSAEICLLTS